MQIPDVEPMKFIYTMLEAGEGQEQNQSKLSQRSRNNMKKTLEKTTTTEKMLGQRHTVMVAQSWDCMCHM